MFGKSTLIKIVVVVDGISLYTDFIKIKPLQADLSAVTYLDMNSALTSGITLSAQINTIAGYNWQIGVYGYTCSGVTNYG